MIAVARNAFRRDPVGQRKPSNELHQRGKLLLGWLLAFEVAFDGDLDSAIVVEARCGIACKVYIPAFGNFAGHVDVIMIRDIAPGWLLQKAYPTRRRCKMLQAAHLRFEAYLRLLAFARMMHDDLNGLLLLHELRVWGQRAPCLPGYDIWGFDILPGRRAAIPRHTKA